MRQINLEARDSDIFKVIDLQGNEVVRISYSKQVDDIMISVDGGDVLLRWDADNWVDDECMLLKEKDNFKEIGKLSCTHLLLKPKDPDVSVRAYICAQLN